MAWKGWEDYVPPVPPSALPMLASPHSRHSVTRSMCDVRNVGKVRMLELRIPRRLESPNTWNGRHWRVKHQISQAWEDAIGTAMCDTFVQREGGIDFPNALAAHIGPRKWLGIDCLFQSRTRVTVERHVPSARNFIRDDDNLRFCVKPLLDALKRQGYIKNDSRKWLEHPTPTQHVSADGTDLTIIRLEPCAVLAAQREPRA